MADVKLKIGADTSEIERAFSNLIKKMQSDADKLKVSPGATSRAGATGDASRLTQVQSQQYTKIVKDLEKELSLIKEIGREREKLNRQEHIANIQKSNFVQVQRAQGWGVMGGVPSAGGGGLKPPSVPPTSGGASQTNGQWLMNGTAGFAGIAGQALNYMGQRPIDIARMQASAISMTTGRQLGEARSGEYTYESMYGDDRKKAQEQASSSKGFKTAGDIAMAIGSVAALIAAVPTGGASLGLGGLAMGGLGLAGLKSSIMDKGMLDPSKYAAYSSQREAQDFTTLLASAHENSPFRKDAIERLKGTGARDLGMQRTLGLSDQGYYGGGGYLQGQMGASFTDEMVTGSSRGILGAGGSSAMAQQSAISLQAQRGLGLTNSDQLLGQLSGTQSIPETSRKTLVDIFARGFDSSKYAEENRKYMQAVTEQVFKGGSTSESSAVSIADLIKASIGGAAPTTRNIEAGKTAYESYKSQGSATSGYMGGINISSAMQDPWLSKIKDPAALTEVLKEGMDIDENDPDVAELAKSIGFPGGAKGFASHIRDRIGKNNEKSLNRSKGSLGMGRRGMIGQLDPGLDTAARRAKENMMNGTDFGPQQYGTGTTADQAAQRMTDKNTGRAGDTMVQASAANAQISLETLSASISKFADDAMKAAQKLGAEAPTGRANEATDTRVKNRMDEKGIHDFLYGGGYSKAKNQVQGN